MLRAESHIMVPLSAPPHDSLLVNITGRFKGRQEEERILKVDCKCILCAIINLLRSNFFCD